MPTKRAGFVLGFSLLLLLGAWLSKVVWLYIAFAAGAGIIIFCYFLFLFLRFGLVLERVLPERAHEDEVIRVLLRIRSRFVFPERSLEVRDTFTAGPPKQQEKSIFISGLSRERFEFFYQETCYKRGRYRIGPCRVKVFEPFGLFFLERTLPVYSWLTVYPHIFAVRRLPFMPGNFAPRFGEQTTRISGDYEEFYGIREYHREDGWRRIHWRSTARLQELMVRHFEQSAQWKVMFLLDAHANNNAGYGKDTAFEYAVKITASLLRCLLRKEASFGILACGAKTHYNAPGRGSAHFHRILEALAVIQPDGAAPLAECAVRFQWAIAPDSTLVVLSSNFSTLLRNILQALKIRKNCAIIPVFLDAASFLAPPAVTGASAPLISKSFADKISPQSYVIRMKDNLTAQFR